MTIQVVGKQKLDFTAQDGKHVKGTSVWYLKKDSYTEGYLPKKMFFADGRTIPFEVGKTYNIYYDDSKKLDLESITCVN